MPKTARDVMTSELITVTPATPLTELARIFVEDEISGCPVVTVDGRLVGIVSKTDLLHRLLEGGHDYSENRDFRALLGLGEENLEQMGGMASESEQELLGAVDEIMQGDVLIVPPEMTLDRVARKMAQNRIHRVLVTQKTELLGIITSLDLLMHFPAVVPAARKSAARKIAGRKPAAGKPASAKKRAAIKAKRR